MKITLTFLISLAATSLLMGQVDGKALYIKKCATCHGLNGEKKAFNTSKIINTLNEKEIADTLFTYKDGSYKGKFKALKKNLMSQLYEEHISSVSAYIQTLKVE